MTDFKTVKPLIYTTPIDVRIMSQGVVQQFTHADTIDVDDARTEMAILRATGIIDLKLAPIITSGTSLCVTPYAGPPIRPQAAYDETTTSENVGTSAGTDGRLYGIVPASTAYTEMWTVTFTSTTAFTVVGSYSGAQGTGSTSTLFTSTNSDITIPIDCWTGTHATGDKFYIPVYKHHRSIVLLATMLATGLIFKGSGMAIRAADNEGAKLYDDAIALLDAIVDAGSLPDLALVTGSNDSRDLASPYEIDVYGFDITRYKDEEFDMTYSGANYSLYERWLD